jgi:hypothetical protein
MSTADTIKNLLVEQIDGYRSLLDLLQRERECLLNLDASGVESISKEKDTTVMRLRLIEEERVRLVGKFSRENMIGGETNLQMLSEITKDDTFRTLRLQLISLLQGIEELNAFNKVLIGRSLNFIKNSMGFLESFGVGAGRSNSGSFFSREI